MVAREDIDIKIVREADPEQMRELYRAGSWWDEEKSKLEELPRLVQGSFAFAVAQDQTTARLVGMGRVISDGVSDGYIQDVIVFPQYRGLGLGKDIIQKLVDHCLRSGVNWLALIAEPGSEGFYKKLEFSRMKDHIPVRYMPGGPTK